MNKDTKGVSPQELIAVAKSDHYSGLPFAIRRSNLLVLFCAIVAALGGFLFGFDTAVISGVEQPLQRLWQLNDFIHGLAVAIALYGTVTGALLAGLIGDMLGRRMMLFLVGILYLVSAVATALAPEIWSFMVFRFIGGLGVGAASVVAP
ncbi:MAG: MFS transporter, partial [Cyclobacteriaceae bacterium]